MKKKSLMMICLLLVCVCTNIHGEEKFRLDKQTTTAYDGYKNMIRGIRSWYGNTRFFIYHGEEESLAIALVVKEFENACDIMFEGGISAPEKIPSFSGYAGAYPHRINLCFKSGNYVLDPQNRDSKKISYDSNVYSTTIKYHDHKYIDYINLSGGFLSIVLKRECVVQIGYNESNTIMRITFAKRFKGTELAYSLRTASYNIRSEEGIEEFNKIYNAVVDFANIHNISYKDSGSIYRPYCLFVHENGHAFIQIDLDPDPKVAQRYLDRLKRFDPNIKWFLEKRWPSETPAKIKPTDKRFLIP